MVTDAHAGGAAGPQIGPRSLDEMDPFPTLAMHQASRTSKLLRWLPKTSGQGLLFRHGGFFGSGAGGLGDAFTSTERRLGKEDGVTALHTQLAGRWNFSHR